MDELMLKMWGITIVVILLCAAFIWNRLSLLKEGMQQKLNSLDKLILKNERGVYKRIDENRELLELLIQETPELFKTHGWIRGWFKCQDEYLLALSYAVRGSETESGIRVRPYPNVPGDPTPHKD